jgi:hypothetical protein
MRTPLLIVQREIRDTFSDLRTELSNVGKRWGRSRLRHRRDRCRICREDDGSRNRGNEPALDRGLHAFPLNLLHIKSEVYY